MMRQAKIIVSGQVQGVFFRDSTKEQAKIRNLKGFVCNMPDGTVKIIAEGEKEQLDSLIEWCQDGPASADVKSVSVDFSPPNYEFETFKVTY